MKYSEFRPEVAGRIVIYGGTMAEKDAFEDAFILNNPSFETSIMPELESYKKPVFGKYKTACEVMVKSLKKADRKLVHDELIRESKGMGLDSLIYRAPRALSGGQRLRWSILYGAVMGKREFVLREDGILMSAENADMAEAWLTRYTKNSAVIVRITEATGDDLDAMLAGGDRGFELTGGELVPYVKPVPKTIEVEVKSEKDEKITKILQMKDKYNGLFSGKK